MVIKKGARSTAKHIAFSVLIIMCRNSLMRSKNAMKLTIMNLVLLNNEDNVDEYGLLLVLHNSKEYLLSSMLSNSNFTYVS